MYLSGEGKPTLYRVGILSAVSRIAICEGFTRVFKAAADLIGLPCIEAGSNSHAFVHVMLDDGKWYGFDPQTPFAQPLNDADIVSQSTEYILYDGVFRSDYIHFPQRTTDPSPEAVMLPDPELVDFTALLAEINSGEVEFLSVVNPDGLSCTVTGCTGGAGAGLTVPSEIGGLPVTAIGDDAFLCAGWFTGPLELPDSIETIGCNAFTDCTGLTGDLSLPASLRSVGDHAFTGCSGLDGALTLNDGLESIGAWAFAYCSSLQGSVYLPDSVTAVGNVAFDYCGSLTGDFRIPDTFTGFTGSIIGETPFSSLTVSPDHPTLTSVDGILYSRDLTRAVKCPAGFIGDVTVPDSVTVIGETAFYMTKSITSLTLPETLEQIERFGICDLTALTSPVHLPASLRSIADSGFRGVLMEESVVCPCPCMIDPSAFTLSHGAKYVMFPEGITAVPEYILDEAVMVSLPSTIEYLQAGYTICTEPLTVIAPASLSGLVEQYVKDSAVLGRTVIPVRAEDCDLFPSISQIALDTRDPAHAEARVLILDRSLALIPPEGCESGDPAVATVDPDGTVHAVADGSTVVTLTAGGRSFTVSVTVASGIVCSSDGTRLVSVSPDYTGELTLPEGIVTIGREAFLGCDGITKLTLPSTLTTLETSALAYFGAGLTEPLVIPASVTKIGPYAFYGVDFHTDVLTLPVAGMDECAFSSIRGCNTVIVPEGVTAIPEECFIASSFTTIQLPDSLTEISDTAFLYMEYNPEPLTVIGSSGSVAEAAVARIAEQTPGFRISFLATDGNGAAAVSDSGDLSVFPAFANLLPSDLDPDYGMLQLTAVNAPASGLCWTSSDESVATVTEDGLVTAVAAGDALISVSSDDVTVSVPVHVSEYLLLSEDGKSVLRCAKYYAGSVVVPEGVTEIGAYAFSESGLVTSLQLPESLSVIGSYAFLSFGYNLTEPFTLPTGLTHVGSYAFNNTSFHADTIVFPACDVDEGAYSMATGFNSLVIPDGVTALPEYCFTFSCFSSVFMPASLQTVPDSCFSDFASDTLVIFGPEGSPAQTIADRLSGLYPNVRFVFIPKNPT